MYPDPSSNPSTKYPLYFKEPSSLSNSSILGVYIYDKTAPATNNIDIIINMVYPHHVHHLSLSNEKTRHRTGYVRCLKSRNR